MSDKLAEILEKNRKINSKGELTSTDIKLARYLDHLKIVKDVKSFPKPNELKISTMSGTCSFGTAIDRHKFVDIVEKILKGGNKSTKIKGIKFGKLVIGDVKVKKTKRKTTKPKKKRAGIEGDDFYNQATFVVNPTGFLDKRNVTIEVFTNGSVSLTGVKQKYDGIESVKYLAGILDKHWDCCVKIDDNLEIIGSMNEIINTTWIPHNKQNNEEEDEEDDDDDDEDEDEDNEDDEGEEDGEEDEKDENKLSNEDSLIALKKLFECHNICVNENGSNGFSSFELLKKGISAHFDHIRDGEADEEVDEEDEEEEDEEEEDEEEEDEEEEGVNSDDEIFSDDDDDEGDKKNILGVMAIYDKVLHKFGDVVNAVKCLKNMIYNGYGNDCLIEMKKCLETKINPIKIGEYKTTMINSNFSLGFSLDPYKLYDILAKEMGIYVSYDPKKYDAVKISFMYNKNKVVQNGVCNCKDDSKGKVCDCKNYKDNKVCDCYSFCKVAKKFKKTNNCQVITIAVFDGAGNVVITGSKDFEHSKAAYKFINTVAKIKYSEIVCYSITQFEEDLKNNKIKEKVKEKDVYIEDKDIEFVGNCNQRSKKVKKLRIKIKKTN